MAIHSNKNNYQQLNWSSQSKLGKWIKTSSKEIKLYMYVERTPTSSTAPDFSLHEFVCVCVCVWNLLLYKIMEVLKILTFSKYVWYVWLEHCFQKAKQCLLQKLKQKKHLHYVNQQVSNLVLSKIKNKHKLVRKDYFHYISFVLCFKYWGDYTAKRFTVNAIWDWNLFRKHSFSSKLFLRNHQDFD